MAVLGAPRPAAGGALAELAARCRRPAPGSAERRRSRDGLGERAPRGGHARARVRRHLARRPPAATRSCWASCAPRCTPTAGPPPRRGAPAGPRPGPGGDLAGGARPPRDGGRRRPGPGPRGGRPRRRDRDGDGRGAARVSRTRRHPEAADRLTDGRHPARRAAVGLRPRDRPAGDPQGPGRGRARTAAPCARPGLLGPTAAPARPSSPRTSPRLSPRATPGWPGASTRPGAPRRPAATTARRSGCWPARWPSPRPPTSAPPCCSTSAPPRRGCPGTRPRSSTWVARSTWDRPRASQTLTSWGAQLRDGLRRRRGRGGHAVLADVLDSLGPEALAELALLVQAASMHASFGWRTCGPAWTADGWRFTAGTEDRPPQTAGERAWRARGVGPAVPRRHGGRGDAPGAGGDGRRAAAGRADVRLARLAAGRQRAVVGRRVRAPPPPPGPRRSRTPVAAARAGPTVWPPPRWPA